jgi:hypothetical protein
VIEAWRAIQRGHFNPSRGDFYAFVAGAARHRLISHAEYLRAGRRWQGQAPVSLELLDWDGGELGSWVSRVDPLRVILAREALRLCWEAQTELRKAAIADYLRRDGQHVPKRTQDAVDRARRQVRPILAPA